MFATYSIGLVVIEPTCIAYGILVIEVKGGAEIDIFNGQWQSTTRYGKIKPIKNPYDQATASKHALLKYLTDQGISKHAMSIMRGVLDEIEAGSIDHTGKPEADYSPSIVQGDGYLEITIAARFEVYGRSQIALDAEGKAIRTFKRSNYNPVLVNALVKSYRWNRQLDSGQMTISDLSKQERRDRTYISRIVNMMMLAPDIISSILTGTQPATMQLQHLTANLPIEWYRQKQILKFPVKAV